MFRLCNKGTEKVNPNVRHTFGWTPIMVAAANGQAEAVEALINCGADMDLQDMYQNPQKTAKRLKIHSLDGKLSHRCLLVSYVDAFHFKHSILDLLHKNKVLEILS